MLELSKGAPGAPDEHHGYRSHGLDARYVAGVLDLSVEPIGNDVPYLGCLVSRQSPVAVAAQHVVEIEIDAHGRDASSPGREHQTVTVVTATGRAKLSGCGDDEPMSLPRDLDRLGLDEGVLVLFDCRADAEPIEDRTRLEMTRTSSGRTVTMLRG
jgi:hypothetical protein